MYVAVLVVMQQVRLSAYAFVHAFVTRTKDSNPSGLSGHRLGAPADRLPSPRMVDDPQPNA
jgi:hypothetical protein